MNEREEVNGTQTGAEEEEQEQEEGGEDSVVSDGAGGNLAPSELMGQSPPASPRATQSPLMFTPQVSYQSFHLFPISCMFLPLGVYGVNGVFLFSLQIV